MVTDDILLRLKRLEEENQRLRQQQMSSQPELRVTEVEWKGHPVLRFEPPRGKPFNLGLKKLETIKEAWSHVEKFIEKYASQSTGQDDLFI